MSQHHIIRHPAKSGCFMLSQAMGEMISAVEGKSLTPRMRMAVQVARGRSLTSEQRRDLIKKTLRQK